MGQMVALCSKRVHSYIVGLLNLPLTNIFAYLHRMNMAIEQIAITLKSEIIFILIVYVLFSMTFVVCINNM